MTALHWAAKRGNFDICYLLLRWKSDVNAIDIVKKCNVRSEDPPFFLPYKRVTPKFIKFYLCLEPTPGPVILLVIKKS